MAKNLHKKFGGKWTEQKLKILKKYLGAYSTIMNKQNFKFAYIDAFAGTGYRTSKKENEDKDFLLEEDDGTDKLKFIKGSAITALEVTPEFKNYIFIEKDKNRFMELSRLREKYPELKNKIKMVNEDANLYIQKTCKKDWQNHRAVMFLDPFGMGIKWETVVAVAETKAIDLWVLFPLGVGVNRLLKKNGQLSDWAKNKLNDIFGTKDWEKEWYEPDPQGTLFNEGKKRQIKTATLDSIGKFFISRIKTVFVETANNPAKLYNSKNNPLFLFCFCAGNPKGASTAVKIAQDILKKI